MSLLPSHSVQRTSPKRLVADGKRWQTEITPVSRQLYRFWESQLTTVRFSRKGELLRQLSPYVTSSKRVDVFAYEFPVAGVYLPAMLGPAHSRCSPKPSISRKARRCVFASSYASRGLRFWDLYIGHQRFAGTRRYDVLEYGQ